MINLILAGVVFVMMHVLISGTARRDAWVARLGERGFQGVFSLVSVLVIVWVVRAYQAAPYIPIWDPPHALRWLTFLLMIVAFLFVVIGLTTPNPTAVGGESHLDDAEPAAGILRVTRHPFLWGVAIWATAHLLANGDAASMVLFLTFLALAHIGPRSIDAKRARRYGAKWERFAAATSNAPFAAIIAGRNHLSIAEIKWWRIVLALVLFGAVLGHHLLIFGVSPYPWR